MEEIEIKIVYAALCELFFENSLRVISACNLMTRIFCSEIEGFAWVFLESLADGNFRKTVMIRVCCVKIIYAVLDGVVCHFFNLFLVDNAVDERKTHCAEAEKRKLLVLKISVNHNLSPCRG